MILDAAAVRARDLVKRFDAFEAVRGISFDIRAGECFGFLGPNGAGKTSTMRMIGCVSPLSDGSLDVLGLSVRSDARRIKRRLGVVPQDDNLEQFLTLRENLLLYGRYFDLRGTALERRAAELLDFVQLGERADTEVNKLSGGMKRRLLVARALINEPELLILDEPTAGLDPQARHLLWEKMRELKAKRNTMILTTHYMDEAEQLCDRLIIMDAGRIVAEGAPRELIRAHSSPEVVEVFASKPQSEALLAEVRGMVSRYETLTGRVLLFVESAEPLLEPLARRSADGLEFLIRRATLEDVFLKLTGRRLLEE